MASLNLAALCYQVGKDVKFSVVTRTVASDDAGNDIIVPGHSNNSVSLGAGVDHASLAKSMAKIPVAKHLATGHVIRPMAEYDKGGTSGIVILFGLEKVKPALEAATEVTTVADVAPATETATSKSKNK